MIQLVDMLSWPQKTSSKCINGLANKQIPGGSAQTREVVNFVPSTHEASIEPLCLNLGGLHCTETFTPRSMGNTGGLARTMSAKEVLKLEQTESGHFA